MRNQLLIWSSSALLGGAIGYSYAVQKLRRAYAELARKDAADLQEWYESKLNIEKEKLEKKYQAQIVEQYQGSDEIPAAREKREEVAVVADKILEYTDYTAYNKQPPETTTATPSKVMADLLDQPTKGPSLKEMAKELGLTPDADTPFVFNEGEDPSPVKLVPLQSDIPGEAVGPHVIRLEEYFLGEKEYKQIVLDYFSEENILSDEGGTIEPVERIGSYNLAKFGEGSDDPDVVYVRNDLARVDYEVVRSMGKYSDKHGQDDS